MEDIKEDLELLESIEELIEQLKEDEIKDDSNEQ